MIFKYISFTPSLVSLFWCVYFLINRQRNSMPQNIMILITLLFSILFFNHSYCAFNLDQYLMFPAADVLDVFLSLSIPSMFYLFFKAMAIGRLRLLDLTSFLPAMVLGTAVCLIYRSMSPEELDCYSFHVHLYGRPLLPDVSRMLYLQYLLAEKIYYLVLLVLIIMVLNYAFTQIKQYHRNLQNFYSCPDRMEMDANTRIYQILIPFFTLLLVFSFFIYSSFFKEYHITLMIIYTTETVLIYALCYYTSLIKYTAYDFHQDMIKSDEADGVPVIDGKEQAMRYKVSVEYFESVLEERKVYLQPNLRIDDVARLMATNRSYLSEMINKEYKMSFSSYINSLRIQYAKSLMLSDKDLTQDKIAEQSGYLNASSFNRSFKSLTGLTPKSWLEEQSRPD
ncbi:MAG: helix-turn-helix transcriptional regulator [Bacteroidales bacterium]